MPRLEGKTALVTGAAGCIGEAIAKRFLNENADVMLVDRFAEKLEATYRRLGAGSNLAQFVAEAADEAATAGAIAATLEAFGGLDILVANAGTEGQIKPFETQTMEGFEEVLRTNVVGVWLAMKHSVEVMRKGSGGSIIAMSSIAGLIGFPGMTPYVASKHAVCGLVKTVALELGESGIRANAICPGPIDDRMMQSIAEQVRPDDPGRARSVLEGLVPMKRYGTSEEVAGVALFLASDESSYCTGQAFTLDGGFTAA